MSSSWQWWCSAQTAAWTWKWQAFPGVWIFIALLAGGYIALRRRVRRTTSDPAALGGRGHAFAFAGSLLALWLALDWPIGTLGSGYLASAHMVQFLLIALFSAPLLLISLPPAVYDALPQRPRLHSVLGFVTHPLIAVVIYYSIVYSTHMPIVNDTLMASQLGSFAIDIGWLLGAVIFWYPIVAPVPERPYFHPILQIAFLTGATIMMTPVFIFLTFSKYPVYSIFELAPQVHGISALEDQALAGLIMKIAGGFILIGALTIIFFRWSLATMDRPDLEQPGGESGGDGGGPHDPDPEPDPKPQAPDRRQPAVAAGLTGGER